MRTADRLNQLLFEARSNNLVVRFEYLNGQGGGVCAFGGKRWLFVDLAQSVEDQLESVQAAMSEAVDTAPPEIGIRRAA